MFLTMKEIAPYLPYGLKVQAQDTEEIMLLFGLSGKDTAECCHLMDIDMVRLLPINTEQTEFIQEYVKPVLRPLSDLTKEIEHNGQRFIPIVDLLKIKHKGWVIEKLNTRYEEIDFEINYNYAKAHFRFMATLSIDVWLKNLGMQDYWIVEKLTEWHFDVFGLIEKSLAIDINSIKSTIN
jgi:hypothetical protein